MNQDQMFKQVGESLRGYSPEVPAHLYGGIRKKLGWSRFLSFSANSLNVYYLGAMLTLGATAAFMYGGGESDMPTLSQVKNYNEPIQHTRQAIAFSAVTAEDAAKEFEEITQLSKNSIVGHAQGEKVNVKSNEFTPASNQPSPEALPSKQNKRCSVPSSLTALGAMLDHQVSTPSDLIVRDQVIAHDMKNDGLASQIINKEGSLKLTVTELRSAKGNAEQ